MEVRIVRIYLSPGHSFWNVGTMPGTHPTQEVREVECVAGRGLRGDRFFDFQPQKFPEGYDGQVTFFAWETFEAVSRQLGVVDKPPSVFRRNVVTHGVDLNEWVGREFELQGVRFLGTEESSPCRWMETAFAPGALKALTGRGGLRAKILTSGTIRVDES